MNGSSGTFGEQLTFKYYKQKKKKKTVITRVQAKRAFDSDAQIAVKENFAKASDVAVSMLCDPAIKAMYASRRKGHETAYNVAMHDIYDTPVIETILTNEYSGRGGSLITLFAEKDNLVKNILVTIRDADGVVIESGYAVQVGKLTEWNYTPVQFNAHVAGCMITAEAVDYAGNSAEYSKEVAVKEKNNNNGQQGYALPDQHYLKPIASFRLLPDVFLIPYARERAQQEEPAALSIAEPDIGFSEDS